MTINLDLPKTIVIVGLSDKPDRPSYQVANYLLKQGHSILPVNPTLTQVLGAKSYPSISSIPPETKIDIVDIFRKSAEVFSIVKEVIKTGKKPLIWMPEGVISEEAKALAEVNGMEVIMNACIVKVHQK